jgi:iron complex outermembrane receptor protein
MAYINGKYDTFVCAVPIFIPGPNPSCAASPNGTVNASGTRFITNPKWQYSVGGRYEHEVGAGRLGGQLDWSWREKPPTTVLNADPRNQALLDSINGSVGLLNARVDYTLPDKGITLAVFATNLTNKHYAAVGTSNLYYSFGLLYATAQEPRMWGVQLTKEF